jgi:hypothetical protein
MSFLIDKAYHQRLLVESVYWFGFGCLISKQPLMLTALGSVFFTEAKGAIRHLVDKNPELKKLQDTTKLIMVYAFTFFTSLLAVSCAASLVKSHIVLTKLAWNTATLFALCFFAELGPKQFPTIVSQTLQSL